jgi:hypothetical protein
MGLDAERNGRQVATANGGSGGDAAAPLAGGLGFREWSDRMRDVEEMVGDPQLRAEAARIRERATALRAQIKASGQAPDWQTVQTMVVRPLADLRDEISREILRRDNSAAKVPVDREPIPPAYADQVRRYYERLGEGSASAGPTTAPASSGGGAVR